MQGSDEKQNGNRLKVVSLESRRERAEKLDRKQYLDAETRLRELEEDMLRVIEMCMELDSTVHSQRNVIFKLLRLLRRREDEPSPAVPTSGSGRRRD